MDFQSQTLWIVILTTIFYMDFEMVQSFMTCWLGTWIFFLIYWKNEVSKVLHDNICKIWPMDF